MALGLVISTKTVKAAETGWSIQVKEMPDGSDGFGAVKAWPIFPFPFFLFFSLRSAFVHATVKIDSTAADQDGEWYSSRISQPPSRTMGMQVRADKKRRQNRES